MDFFEKIGETVVNVSKEATDKAKEFAELASLKSQIHTCEEVMKKNYQEIGKIYYDNFANSAEELFVKQVTAIKNAQEGKEALEAKIKEIKNIQKEYVKGSE